MASERKEDSKIPLFCVKICKYSKEDEVLALTLARKSRIKEIVDFFGATIAQRGRIKEVHVFMEYMAGRCISGPEDTCTIFHK